MSNLPTNSLTKEAEFEKLNCITNKEDSDGESVSAQTEVVKTRENPLNKDAPVLSTLEWNNEMNQYSIGDKVGFLVKIPEILLRYWDAIHWTTK
eukprot:13984570-Ditylum_brightwellii.AAC.1